MRRVSFGLETGSQRLLDAMDKGCTIERNSAFIHEAHEAGISAVHEAVDAPAALQCLAQHGPFDLAVLDIEMPGGSGLQLAAQLPPATRCVFSTAYEQHALRAFELALQRHHRSPPGGDRHPGAFGQTGLDDAKADAATGAGDEDHLVLEVEVHGRLPCCFGDSGDPALGSGKPYSFSIARKA
jgi:CheY-like chemotaxis protein